MKPSERAREVVSDLLHMGIASRDQLMVPVEEAIEAAEREAFEAGYAQGKAFQAGYEDPMTYEDWRSREDD